MWIEEKDTIVNDGCTCDFGELSLNGTCKMGNLVR
jgi:hypothetical protein